MGQAAPGHTRKGPVIYSHWRFVGTLTDWVSACRPGFARDINRFGVSPLILALTISGRPTANIPSPSKTMNTLGTPGTFVGTSGTCGGHVWRREHDPSFLRLQTLPLVICDAVFCPWLLSGEFEVVAQDILTRSLPPSLTDG